VLNKLLGAGAGGTSVFRTFQGWLGLSEHGPQQGTLVTHPILQPSTAYWLLRPFFTPTRAGSLDGWKFTPENQVSSHGPLHWLGVHSCTRILVQELPCDRG
jgi:hypothetical protein